MAALIGHDQPAPGRHDSLRDKKAGGDAEVAGIGDIDVIAGIHGDARRQIEVGRGRVDVLRAGRQGAQGRGQNAQDTTRQRMMTGSLITHGWRRIW